MVSLTSFPVRAASSMMVLIAGASMFVSCGEESYPTSPSSTEPEVIRRVVLLNEDLSMRQVFPEDNWWNQDIRDAPVDPDSASYIDWVGRETSLHPDFGPAPFGIPYVTVSGQQPKVPVRFVFFPEESDEGAPGETSGYPIPEEARLQPGYIEGAVPGGGSEGDRHLVLIDRDAWVLYETFATQWNEKDAVWQAGSGAIFELDENHRRPERWTSADAAGLAIFPGLVRFDEVSGPDEIRHAFRVTLRATDGYVWPASHDAGNSRGALPLGARLRLKASVDFSDQPESAQKIFRAMQHYGLIVADNGSDMFVTGTMDRRWDNDVLNPAFRTLSAGDFEVVELGWR